MRSFVETAMNIAAFLRAGFAAPLLLLAACSSLSVSSHKYPQADFSGYRSYAWIAVDPVIRPRGAQPEISALTVRSIREAIEAEFAARGYKAVAVPADADFVVAFTVGARDRIDAQSYPVPYRGPWEWGWYRNATELRVYREGTLAIDIFDGATRQPVWNGRARKEITSADESDPQPAIRKAVASILRKFP
jgi:hypothetical protein